MTKRKFFIFPYMMGSKGVKELAQALQAKQVRLEGSKYKERTNHQIINWGNSDCGFPNALNYHATKDITNKLSFFRNVKEAGLNDLLPPWYEDKGEIPDEAFPVVCRTVLTGHSGRGIVIADNRDELVDAPLYTSYIKKKDEYRIHVGRGRVISIQRKALRNGFENPDFKVRNLENGFVYVRGEVDPPQQVLDAAVTVFNATNLDFGAVDVIWNEKYSRAYVLEINTAPGLQGQTVEDYANFFMEIE